jgi:pSer/pThr/pTyr-binding forkhead associated (FHA) protein
MSDHDHTVTGARPEGEKPAVELPPGLKVYLEVTAGPDQGLKVEVTKTITTLGRNDTDVKLTDHTVSSRHAHLEISRDDILLYDQKSTNGTFVNGEKITTCPLKNLDEIQLGETKLLISVVHDQYGIYSEDFLDATPVQTPGIVDTTRVDEKGPATNPELPAGLQVMLKVTAGPHQGQRFRLTCRSTMIGRREADIVLNDKLVSGRHAQLEVHSKDKITIKDLASTNGTLVNGKPASAVKLHHGDQITIGKTIFVLSVRSG